VIYFDHVLAMIMLYVQTLVYGAMAWYLNQIVPQQYGVPKKWDFLWNSKKKAEEEEEEE